MSFIQDLELRIKRMEQAIAAKLEGKAEVTSDEAKEIYDHVATEFAAIKDRCDKIEHELATIVSAHDSEAQKSAPLAETAPVQTSTDTTSTT